MAREPSGQQDRSPSWCLSAVDIFADLDADEMARLAGSAPELTFSAGDLIYTPHQAVEQLLILKQGRVRLYRLSPEGRALTTAVVSPGTIVGQMPVLGQQLRDTFAEALEDAVVCVMGRQQVQRLLLADPRIARRLAESLGRRVLELEQRLSDTVFKSAHARIADAILMMLPARPGPLGRLQVRLTHEQLAGLAGTSRETTTKVLGELAAQRLISLGRGRITVLEVDGLRQT